MDGWPDIEKPYEPEQNHQGVPCGPIGGLACGMKSKDRSFVLPEDDADRVRLEKHLARENYAATMVMDWHSGKRGFGKFDWRHGNIKWDNDDIYVGEMTIDSNCNGKGVMYKYKSGEAHCGTWAGKLWKYPELEGEGVCFSKDRLTAEKLMDGKPTGQQISVDEALAMLELKEAPHVYSKSYMKELREKIAQERKDKAEHEKKHVYRWDFTWKGAPIDMTPKEITPQVLDKAMNQIRQKAYPI